MRDDKQKLKIELLSQRKLEAESRKNATKFFGSEITLPPSQVFRKFIEFGTDSLP